MNEDYLEEVLLKFALRRAGVKQPSCRQGWGKKSVVSRAKGTSQVLEV